MEYGKCGRNGFPADTEVGPIAADPCGEGCGRSLVSNRRNDLDVFCTPYRMGAKYTDGMGYPTVCDYNEVFAPAAGSGY